MARSIQAKRSTKSKKERQGTGLFGGPADVAVARIVIIVASAALFLIGVVMVYSSSAIEAIVEGNDPTFYLVRQLGIGGISIILCALIAWKLPYYVWLGRPLWVFWLASIVLLLLTALIGTAELGAQRWLTIGPVSFQPSEFAKPAFLLMMARIMYNARLEDTDFLTLAKQVGLLVIAPIGVLYATQTDLGTAFICLVGLLVVLWIADVPAFPIVGMLIGLIVFVVLAVALVGFRSDRMVFLDPYAAYDDKGYQLVRSFYAFGSGGLFGVGIGNSAEKYQYLPEAETDFVFAIIGEEMGFLGAALVVLLFMAVLVAGLKIAKNAPDLFGSMVAGSCTVMLVFQAFINIACVIGLMPTTGKPLPFISQGGSSLLGSFILLGIILSVSFASGDASGVYQNRRENLRIVRTGQPKRAVSRTSSGSGWGGLSLSTRTQASSLRASSRSEDYVSRRDTRWGQVASKRSERNLTGGSSRRSNSRSRVAHSSRKRGR